MFGLISPLGIACVVLYFYVAWAAYIADRKSGKGFWSSARRALTWPATIWDTIQDLYDA